MLAVLLAPLLCSASSARECSSATGTCASSRLEALRTAVAGFTTSPLDGEDAQAAHELVAQLNAFLLEGKQSAVAPRSSSSSSLRKRSAGTSDKPAGTTGKLFNATWLAKTSHLYNAETGTELVAPLLYTLVRTIRPKVVVELGCGYTTLFLAQALRDAAADAAVERSLEWQTKKSNWLYWGSQRGAKLINEWANLGAYFGNGSLLRRAEEVYRPMLHCVDTFTAEGDSPGHYTSAAAFKRAAKELGVRQVLTTHQRDWVDWANRLGPDFPPIDLLWWDGFQPPQFPVLWPRVNPDGGLCVLHSTLGNSRNWAWLQELKLKQATTGFNDFELLSLLEPHKWAQNSLTALRRTSGYVAEEVVVRPHP